MARTIALNVMDPIRDDNPIPLWLVPGDWSRGRAVAHVAEEEGVPFTRVRAQRTWMTWDRGIPHSGPYWTLDDGYMAPCDKQDHDAEPYWEVTVPPPSSTDTSADRADRFITPEGAGRIDRDGIRWPSET